MSANPVLAPSSDARSTPGTRGGWVVPAGGAAQRLRAALGLPRELWTARDLVRASVRRELAARLTGTLLGPLWPLVTPLALGAAYWGVFTGLLGLGRGVDPGAQAAYVFAGTLLWSAFADALARGTASVVEQRGLLQKLAYPAAVLPLVPVLTSLALLAPSALVCVLALALAGVAHPTWASLAALPVALVLTGIAAYGLASALAAVHGLVRDVQHALALGLTFALFATPVFWDPRTLPLSDAARAWLAWNPLARLVDAWRAILGVAGADAPGPWADLLAFAPFAVLGLALGAAVFALLRVRFADEV